MVQACRVCEDVFNKTRDSPTYCTVLLDITELQRKCVQLELDLKDSCNAFCFKCRHISMSVPKGVSTDEQVCYLQSQVKCFNLLESYNLFIQEEWVDSQDKRALVQCGSFNKSISCVVHNDPSWLNGYWDMLRLLAVAVGTRALVL